MKWKTHWNPIPDDSSQILIEITSVVEVRNSGNLNQKSDIIETEPENLRI